MADSTRTSSPAALSDVPEEDASVALDRRSRSPYGSTLSSASTSTFHGGGSAVSRTPSAASATAPGGIGPPPRSPGPVGPRKPNSRPTHAGQPSLGEIERPTSVAAHRGLVEQPSALSLRKKGSDGTIADSKRSGRRPAAPGSPAPGGERERDASGAHERHKFRRHPHMPHDAHAEEVPATGMHWFVAPVHGLLPARGWRAHTVNIVDHVAWIFGGCDEKGGWQDIWLFDTESFQWSHPDMTGDIPPPCRAHTSTLVDRKLVVYGGGQGAHYYSDVFVLDTLARRWARADFRGGTVPAPRRAHTAEYYRGRVYVFGGGNGTEAVNDVWALDVGAHAHPDRMRWDKVDVHGPRPCARGYHTANIVGSVMVVIGGSDGKECFSDVWCLHLDALVWTPIKLELPYRRLSHTSTQIGSYLYVFGGHDGAGYKNELMLFNLTTLQYEARVAHGRRPSLRGYHVAFLADSRVFFVGGFNGHDVYDDVHCLELAASSYLPQVTSFEVDLENAPVDPAPNKGKRG